MVLPCRGISGQGLRLICMGRFDEISGDCSFTTKLDVMTFRLVHRSFFCFPGSLCTGIYCLAKAVALVVRHFSSLQDVHSAEA